MLKNKVILFLVFSSFFCLTGRTPENVKNFEGKVLEKEIDFDGKERKYRIYLPKDYVSTRKYPLIFGLHGGGGTGEHFNKLTTSNYMADKYGVVMVYPDGWKKHWNDGRSKGDTSINDVGFLDLIVNKMVQNYSIDKTRVYSMGISNGGLMSFRLACERSNTFTAMASVVALMGEELSENCKPNQPVSVYLLPGTDDPLIPYQGGDITGPFGKKKLGEVLSAKNTLLFWSKLNGCYGNSQKTVMDTIPDDGTSVKREIISQCSNGAEVRMDTIVNGGHTWPQGWQYFGEWVIGKTSQEINATEEIFRFLLRFHK
ncbi:MAG: prolyl oligopeptidase family serine peptidase [Leptospiraceae bacterium]|nr:prolyl oligopeptidase family serine peptidase [Leptospiraceae bacterium]